MKYALVNPRWEFGGSTYFGCPETHIPLELMFARQQLERSGHDALLIDAHLENLSTDEARGRVERFSPDFLVVTDAPTYLFWRCPQPELRVPAIWLRELRGSATAVAIGPHSSATPHATAEKLECEVVMRGEPDQTLGQLASGNWNDIEGCCWKRHGRLYSESLPLVACGQALTDGSGRPLRSGRLHAASQSPNGFRIDARIAQVPMESLGALDFIDYPLPLRSHRHHVFKGEGRGAELEFSRGCPWNCNFCNKQLFRNKFRERQPDQVLAEAETLVRNGFDYLYFIDEIFGAGQRTRALLEGLAQLPITFGMQTRIDLWDEETLELLGKAHCISVECGIESITAEGRERFRKNCRMSTERIGELLRHARRFIPWVQANLIADDEDNLEAIEQWRKGLINDGVWVSKPVPLYPFPGTPLFVEMFGPPGDDAWELAHNHYLGINNGRHYYSDIQDAQPLPLVQLESAR